MPNQKKAKNNDKRWRITSLIIIMLMVIGGLLLAFPPQEKINQGLDIQGGLSVVLSAESTTDEPVSRDDMEKSKAIIEDRVNALGASEAVVQVQGDDQILVQIPGLSDSEEALATIGKTGVLEFARLDSFTDETVRDQIDAGNIYVISEGSTDAYVSEGGTSYPLNNTQYENMSVEAGTYTPLFTGDHIQNVTVGKASDVSADYAVNITLDSEAAATFAQASRDLLPTHGKIVIIIDGKVNSAPAVQSEILTGQVQITGSYTLAQAKSLQTVLDSGSLPVSFHYEQSTTVGPTLGQGELQAGVIAMLLGLLLVMFYLIVFYRGFGLLTAANMLIFACIYLGVLAGLSLMGAFSLSLAGIAGIILSIGMAADSSILVVERFKEELKEGRSMKAASISGVKHAITTSIDADFVSIISALALFFLATSSVKGFGLTLALGIICDIIVMLMFKAPVVRLLAPMVMRNHPGFWGMKYSLQLGDVRTGGHNYMDKEELLAERLVETTKNIEKVSKKNKNSKIKSENDNVKNRTIPDTDRISDGKDIDEQRQSQSHDVALTKPKNEVEFDDTDIDESSDAEPTTNEEDHSDIKGHSKEEIASILASTGIFASEKDDIDSEEKYTSESSFSYSGPEEDDIGKIDATEIEAIKSFNTPKENNINTDTNVEQPYMNRVQRRAMAKINRSKKIK